MAGDIERRPAKPLLLLAAAFVFFAACAAGADPLPAGTAAEPSGAPPPAPAEMENFAFLLGEWDCAGRWRQGTGPAREFAATWRAREVLDGHVIFEEYRAFWPNGETFVYGTNYRMFDAAEGRWITRWQSAIDGTGFELGQPAFSRDAQDRPVVTFLFGEGEALQRAIYRALGRDRFTWQGDSSEDNGSSWDEAVMVIDCARR